MLLKVTHYIRIFLLNRRKKLICLTLTHSTIEECTKDALDNAPYCDIYELRVDYLTPEEQKKAKVFPTLVDKPVILTLRRISDGGKCDLGEKSRRAILLDAMSGPFTFVDIEDDIKKGELESTAREKGIKIIRSYHDFKGVPDDIYAKIQLLSSRGDIAKIAVTPHSMMDVIKLFKAKDENKDTPKIVIGMGDMGVATRILYKKTGSLLTFASSSTSPAPGMINVKTLKELYRADKVNDNTGIYGIVGNPVMHSLSPLIHNLGFQKIHYNAIYVPFLSDSIRSFMVLAEYLKMRGFSVTVPFKVDVLSYLGNISREVKQIGSCNTVIRVPNMWKGSNTDYYGFLSPLIKDIDSGRIKNALVIGAGGASQAIVWALSNRNINVVVLNRTFTKAEKIASRFRTKADSLENAKAYEGWADLIVQTTKAGMKDDPVNPIEGFVFSGKEIAYDIVYAPKETPFLIEAKKKGCIVHYGLEMLLEQGRHQFEAFTGYFYPKGLDPFSE